MRFALLFICACFLTNPSIGDEIEPALRAHLERELHSWSQSAVLIEALRAINAERASPTGPESQATEAAAYLSDRVSALNGEITEAVLLDASGHAVITAGHVQYGAANSALNQLNIAIADPNTGAAIGAITVTIDVDGAMQ